jgi:hypothetical protein
VDPEDGGMVWKPFDHQLSFTVDKHNSQGITEKMPVLKINLQHKKY